MGRPVDVAAGHGSATANAMSDPGEVETGRSERAGLLARLQRFPCICRGRVYITHGSGPKLTSCGGFFLHSATTMVRDNELPGIHFGTTFPPMRDCIVVSTNPFVRLEFTRAGFAVRYAALDDRPDRSSPRQCPSHHPIPRRQ
jgi:hypothetical protein